MHTDSTQAVKKREVGDLLTRLHLLLQAHRAELGEQHLEHELEWLEHWIDSYTQDAQGQSGSQMDEQALDMLRDIHDTLAEATAEEQRMQSESPLSGNMAEQHLQVLGDTSSEVDKLLHSMRKITVKKH